MQVFRVPNATCPRFINCMYELIIMSVKFIVCQFNGIGMLVVFEVHDDRELKQ